MNVLEVVSKVAERDEATAKIMVRELLYDALVRELDQIGEDLDRDVLQVVGKGAGQALRHLAVSKAVGRGEVADNLAALVLVSKDRDDPATPWYDARDESGRFTAGTLRGRITDGMKLMTAGRGEDSLSGNPKTAQLLRDTVGGDKYSRARVMGNALTAINTPETRALGTLSRVIGEIGPEAQQALEPGLRRLAYRYRGTEKRPSQDLQRQASLLSRLAEGDVPDAKVEPRAHAELLRLTQETRAETTRDTMQTAGMRGGGPREVLSPGAAALSVLQGEMKGRGSRTPDQRRMDAVGTLGVLALRDQVPDPAIANISREAGRMPPSLGLMMDKNGRIISEAMGFNGDHYLPFDLKNLKGLQGGQYVRTRTGGGPTDEDIYTGLMSGARQIQVVSNSGVFTLEFDPDLRGGRRYSDKAAQMVDRYGKLVAAIESGGVEANPIPREQVKQMRAQALEDAKGNATLADTYFKDRLLQAQQAAKFTDIDEDDLMDQAREIADREWKAGQTGNKPTTSTRTRLQTQQQVFTQLKGQALEERYRTYKADGEGYHAALKALKQEFPYFIRRVDREPLGEYLLKRKALGPDDPIPGRGGRDPGYTQPNALAPKGMDQGRPRSIGEGKESARAETADAPASTATPAAPAAAAEAPAAAAHPAAAPGQLAAPVAREMSLGAGLMLAMRRTLDPRDFPMAPTNESEAAAKDLGPHQWSDWVSNNKQPHEVVPWLMNPSTDPLHLDKAVEATRALKKLRERFPDDEAFEDSGATVEGLERLEGLLTKVKQLRKPFADPADDPVLADPTRGAPQPFPDIAGLDDEGLDTYASKNPEVARMADTFMQRPEAEIISDIAEDIDWIQGTPDTDPKKHDFQLAVNAGQQPPELVDLEVKQRAWTLARARALQAFQRGEDPAPFGKAATRRQPRVVQPGSPVAKAYAQSLARSRSPRRQPASR